MMAEYKGLRWVPSTSYIEQGVKGNRVPKNAIRGGNGSYRCTVPGEVSVKFSVGKKEIEFDVMHDLRVATGRQRVTKKLVKAFNKEMAEIGSFEYDEDGRILGIDKAFEKL